MRIKIIIVLLLMSLCIAHIQAVEADELRVRLERSFSELKSLQANVAQTNYFAQIKKSINYTGMIYYEPSQLLLRFDKPHLQRLHIKASQVQLYDAQSRSMLISELQAEYARMNPLQLLQHYWDKSTVSIQKQQKNLISLRMDPRKDSFIRSINATIDYNTGLIQELSYRDHSENTVTYKFSNIRTGINIDKKVWSFSPPKDTEYIRN